MKKEWTIDNLKMDSVEYKACGQWNGYRNEFDINYSSILTKLIQEAGRWCEYYASDLFIDWASLMDKLHNHAYNGGTFLFGFRKMGVDHTGYILSNLSDGRSTDYYRSVWRLDVEIDSDDIRMIFGKVNL